MKKPTKDSPNCNHLKEHNIGYHTPGEKTNTAQKIGKLRFFVPAHTHYIPIENPRFKGQYVVNEINNKRLQEQLDDGAWIDVPTVCET